ncbi:hypothetical protein [Prochlorothrix hollandica]|uniref:Uncharacterized protein n=1 Tax=Prochlorothrix hollandica PCC 9006 = CALU 1027 TaxID=317619 RepID=A0A0M2PYN6_PROHO|nr:hypothetical protein [Prochlorothrix hollandica]KKJ01546.1 hypothetical protein PROH_04410 [Prochlorothrix hollandica PCC 9006 = CALU 1027]
MHLLDRSQSHPAPFPNPPTPSVSTYRGLEYCHAPSQEIAVTYVLGNPAIPSIPCPKLSQRSVWA